MKKLAILILALMCANAVSAQIGNPPTKESPIGNGGVSDDVLFNFWYNQTQVGSNERNNPSTPIAPATLLLLGLGGATVGVSVFRNSKKGGE